jgi:hypothetical protein
VVAGLSKLCNGGDGVVETLGRSWCCLEVRGARSEAARYVQHALSRGNRRVASVVVT